MKNKIIGIFVCMLLIFTIASSVNAIESKKINLTSINNSDEVDLVIYGEGWWSPAPLLENNDYLGIYWQIKNIGDEYKGNDLINISVYLIYPDHEEQLEGSSTWGQGIIHRGLIMSSYAPTIIRNEKPERIRFEVDTIAPESNKQNNFLTVKVEYGVTVYGNIFYKTITGELHHLKSDWEIKCNSDISPFIFKYGTRCYNNNSNYVFTAPKKAGDPSFSYILRAHIEDQIYRIRIKRTPKLDGFEYAEIDFIFGFCDRSVNPIERLFQRAPNLFPILQLLLQRFGLQ